VFKEAFMKMFFANFGVFVIVPVLCAAGLQKSVPRKASSKAGSDNREVTDIGD
jgi:hypothetical protein